jgi:hypothetical protein
MHTDGVIVCRKSFEGGPSKRADRPLAIAHVSSLAVASFTPPPAGGAGLMIRSTIEAKDSVL